ncbi:MAG: FAD-dependent oxidoreductase [Chloroflexaceae bacterium]|nr:FAD-dependent oxidoreductase [Chloroflexaceae bacterium]
MHIAIIGAGVAGLAAAQKLTERGLTCTIYEKSQGVGGRAATRRVHGCHFDHGAQYVKAPTPELEALVRTTTDSTGASAYDIGRPVWTFDAQGRVYEGDPAQNADPKWCWPAGVNALGKAMAQGLDVRRGVTIATVAPQDLAAGDANAVLFTAPAPQTAAIIAASRLDAGVQAQLLAELVRASYRRCISVTFAYPRCPVLPWYALVNTDRGHPISWLACEHDKTGHAPAGLGLITAQMAHDWSVAHWDELAPTPETQRRRDTEPAFLNSQLLILNSMLQSLIGQELGEPLWANVQRWRYALPDAGADFERLNSCGSGLYFAGDYVAGQGRVHMAIESGWRVAQLMKYE